MGQELYWKVLRKRNDENGKGEYREYDTIMEDSDFQKSPYNVLTVQRKTLDIIFSKIFPSNSSNFHEYLTLKELIQKLEDKEFYNKQKELLVQLGKEPKFYDEVISVVKSLTKLGLPEEIEVGLAIC